MKNWKKFLTILAVVLIAMSAYGLYMYQKEPDDIRRQQAMETIAASDLVDQFNKDESVANQRYLDQVIKVKGEISDISVDEAGRTTVFLKTNDPLATVTCSFYDDESAAVKGKSRGETVSIKGKCTGKLIDVVLNKCSLEENPTK